LAARDSTRTEAGFPLYGQELAGAHGIDPFEAGFAAYVKLHKAFFIGRDAAVHAYRERTREIVRFRVAGAGTRPIHPGAPVIDPRGGVLGRVTSCINLGDQQIGMALVQRLGMEPGTAVIFLTPPRGEESAKASSELSDGDHVAVPVGGEVLPRFPLADTNAAPASGGE
jgi:glycine hydroxymethyltransferase